MKVKKTEELQVDIKDDLNIENVGEDLVLYSNKAVSVKLGQDEVTELIAHLQAWIDTGDLEIVVAP